MSCKYKDGFGILADAAIRKSKAKKRPPADVLSRRKVPRLDHSQRLSECAAASRLQAWYRSLYVDVWDTSGTTIVRIRRAELLVRLVEPTGCSYWFRASDLAFAFVSIVSSLHPITRRELLPVELSRINKGLSERLALLFTFTRRYRERACESQCNFLSLQRGLCTFAGEKLDAALTNAELDNTETTQSFELIEEYEECVRSVAKHCQTNACTDLLRLHAQQARRREILCDPFIWDMIIESVSGMQRRYASYDNNNSPVPAIVYWLREGIYPAGR